MHKYVYLRKYYANINRTYKAITSNNTLISDFRTDALSFHQNIEFLPYFLASGILIAVYTRWFFTIYLYWFSKIGETN